MRRVPRWQAALLAGLIGAAGAASAAPEALLAHVADPRAFGYFVSDVATRRITIDVPDGLTLDPASLPQIGQRGRALELRAAVLQSHAGGRRLDLRLDYQIFLAPREVRVLEMPPVLLRFAGTPREQTLRIEAWPLSVAPLVPIDAPARNGLGELRPDVEPPLIDTAPVRTRLFVEAAFALLLLAYLAHVYLGLPWWARRHRPFGMAWRALRSIGSTESTAARRDAFEQMHLALNRTAGAVLFEPGLDRFIAAHPRYAALRADLAAFFQRSRREFFGTPGGQDDLRWLVALCRRCRDVERGSA